MKKWVAVVTLVILLISSVPVFAEDTYSGGWIAGQAAAESHNTTGAAVGGFASGFLFGLIGGGIALGINALGAPEVPALQLISLEGKSSEYKQGFIQGYQQKAKSKKIASTAIGAGIGVVSEVFLFLAIK